MSAINIGVIGTGFVGSCFLRQLAPIAKQFGIAIVYAANADNTLISQDYSPLNVTDGDFKGNSEPLSFEKVAEFLSKSPVPSILVDNTSSEALARAYPEFTSRGVSIATPNKKAFSSEIELWNKLQTPKAPALVYHESTVGAGLPIISSVKDLIVTGDKIQLIEGIFSGTLSYIFNEFSKPNAPAFSEIVKIANSKGFTEPDPRDDLNGLDVARKVTILARLAGLNVVSPTSFPVESLIPKPLESAANGQEFLDNLHKYDNEMTERKENAAKNGKVLRFVGQADITKGEVKVVLKEYDTSHPFASLSGSDNVVSFTTERYPNPLIIQGAGAGDQVTAMGVLADVLKITQRLAK